MHLNYDTPWLRDFDFYLIYTTTIPVNFPTNLNISEISAVSYTPVTNKDLDKGLIYLGPLGV